MLPVCRNILAPTRQDGIRQRAVRAFRGRRAQLPTISGVVESYAEQLTLQQPFCNLVGRHGYEKAERTYDRLGELLNRARRAELIAMEVIRHDGLKGQVAP
jgi:hypothetical protein